MQHERDTRVAATNARVREEDIGGTSYQRAPTYQTTPSEQVRPMVEVAAYYRAEKRGFQGGDPTQDWFEAEREIDAMLKGANRNASARTN